MNIDNNSQGNTNDQSNQSPEGAKTFTQEQVNAIVAKRLAEQKASLASELDKREKEVNRREMQVKAVELLSAKGLSRDLASVLKYDDEKELEAAIEMIGNMQGAKAETKPDRRLIIENKLPDTHGQSIEPDQFRKAFGLTN